MKWAFEPALEIIYSFIPRLVFEDTNPFRIESLLEFGSSPKLVMIIKKFKLLSFVGNLIIIDE